SAARRELIVIVRGVDETNIGQTIGIKISGIIGIKHLWRYSAQGRIRPDQNVASKFNAREVLLQRASRRAPLSGNAIVAHRMDVVTIDETPIGHCGEIRDDKGCR